MSHIVDPRQEHPPRIRARIDQEIPDAPGRGILAIELPAQHVVEQGRQRAPFHWQAEHLHNPLEVADPEIAQSLSGLGEGHQFAIAPVGLLVSRRNHRHENGGPSQLLLDLVRENLRARQPFVAPHFGAPSHMDVDKVLQLLMKNVDPPGARIAEGLVVDVAVADEDLVVVAADQSHGAMLRVPVGGERVTSRDAIRQSRTSNHMGRFPILTYGSVRPSERSSFVAYAISCIPQI